MPSPSAPATISTSCSRPRATNTTTTTSTSTSAAGVSAKRDPSHIDSIAAISARRSVLVLICEERGPELSGLTERGCRHGLRVERASFARGAAALRERQDLDPALEAAETQREPVTDSHGLMRLPNHRAPERDALARAQPRRARAAPGEARAPEPAVEALRRGWSDRRHSAQPARRSAPSLAKGPSAASGCRGVLRG